MIGAVFFDGDQTLWDFEDLMRRALTATLGELRALCPGRRTSDLDVDSLITDRNHVAAESGTSELNLERVRLAAFGYTLDRLGLFDVELAEHLNRFYLERRYSGVQLFPDVLPALTTLATSYRLGLLTNGNGYPDRYGLAGIFDVVVVAHEHGYAKPDRRLFDIASEKIRVAPGHSAMIGDSLINDVLGAQRAGWRGIWLNRDLVAASCPAGITPDATLETLLDASNVLAGWAGAPPTPPTSPDHHRGRRGPEPATWSTVHR